MFCFNCGSQIPDDSVFCPKCGAKVAAEAAQKKASAEKPAEIEKDNFPASNPTPKPQESPPQKGKGKEKKIIAIVAVLVLLIAAGGVFACFHFSGSSFDSNSTDSNTLGNTPSNLMYLGLATEQNGTIYFSEINKEENGVYTTVIKSMSANGKNEQDLYEFDGPCVDLNIIGNNLYFVGWNDYDWFYTSSIYCLNISKRSLETLIDSETLSFNCRFPQFYVTKDKMYFYDGSSIYSADLDGSNLTDLNIGVEEGFGGFVIAGSYIFYVGYDSVEKAADNADDENVSFYRCDLNGNNVKEMTGLKIESFCNGAWNINDNRIYYTKASENETQLLSVNFDGEDEKEIVSVNDDRLYIIGVNDDRLYLENGNLLWSINLDGADKKEYDMDQPLDFSAICGHWIFTGDQIGNLVITDFNDVSQ